MNNDISEFVKTAIEYDYDEFGYTIQVIQEGDIIDEYEAGNNPYESTDVLSDLSKALPIRTIEKYAKSTAKDYFNQYNADSIEVNEDIRADLREQMEANNE